MTAVKTNERPGTRAQVRHVRMSATKARAVLDLIRNQPVDEAEAILAYTERGAAEVVVKALNSAVANAVNNDGIDPETLFVSSCYADEGRTLYRYRPRARGRATKIRKRTCHITVIVSPMPADMLAQERTRREAIPGSRAARRRGQESADRAARVAASQQVDDEFEDLETTDEVADETTEAVDETTEAVDDVVEDTEAVDATAQVADDTAAEAEEIAEEVTEEASDELTEEVSDEASPETSDDEAPEAEVEAKADGEEATYQVADEEAAPEADADEESE